MSLQCYQHRDFTPQFKGLKSRMRFFRGVIFLGVFSGSFFVVNINFLIEKCENRMLKTM